jgi:predicted DNA-binding transcriptional regulator YafY
MASTSERMLRLLSLLQSRRFWPGGELAARLEVSERTVRRDVDRLRGLGYPVHAVSGVAGGYQMRSGAVMPPLLLDGDEAVAIAIGLSSAAVGSLAGIEETSVRALSKIVHVMPPGLRRRVHALQEYIVPQAVAGPTVDANTLAVIAQAARDGERLRFRYRAHDDVETSRHVEPHRLVPQGRRWYLVAWDLERADWRTFRMDRLSTPGTTGERFRARELPGGQDADAFIRSSLGALPRMHEVEVHLSAPPDHVRRRVGRWAEVEPLDDGRARVTMRIDDLRWAALLLAEFGVPFTVIAPDEMRDYLRRLGSFLMSGESPLADRN